MLYTILYNTEPLYTAIVLPSLDYCDEVWDNHTKTAAKL